jgi:hypothetical protein
MGNGSSEYTKFLKNGGKSVLIGWLSEILNNSDNVEITALFSLFLDGLLRLLYKVKDK